MRPILRPRHQSLPHRILPNVIPFLLIILCPPQPRIPMPRLPLPHFLLCRLTKQPLPVTHPTIQPKLEPPRRTKKMNMIRHQQIIPNQPPIRLPPSLHQPLHHSLFHQPRHTLLRAHRYKNNRRTIPRNQNPRSRLTPPNNLRIHIATLNTASKPARAQKKWEGECPYEP